MSNTDVYEDQSIRNTLGFDVTCQIQALLEMLRSEQQRHDDMQKFNDLLNAVIPRLEDLNDSAMSLFSDPVALNSGELVQTIRGRASKAGTS